MHLDSGYLASFGLFHNTRDCVFSKSYIHKQLQTIGKLSSSSFSSEYPGNSAFNCLLLSLSPCQVPSPQFLADVTSCRCSEIFVRRVEVGGCSRTEVEDRSPSSYGQSQVVLDTLGVSWSPLSHHLSSR